MATDNSLLAKVKTSLRISHSALDGDVLDTINACFADLRMCGVQAPLTAENCPMVEPLVLNAVKLYCKASYTDDPVKAARFQTGYDALKSCLMMSAEYAEEESFDE